MADPKATADLSGRMRWAGRCSKQGVFLPVSDYETFPVYAGFVLPGWRADRERAEAEARRADAEAQARQRLEHELAALRARLAQGRML